MAKKVKKAAKSAKNSVKSSQKLEKKPLKASAPKLSTKKAAAPQKSKDLKAKGLKSSEKTSKSNEGQKTKTLKSENSAGMQSLDKKSPKDVSISKSKSSEDIKSKKNTKKLSKEDAEFEDLADDLEYEETVLADNFRTKTKEEIEEIRSLLGEASVEDMDEVEIALRDAEGRLYCKVRECDELAIVDGYCRLHYLKYWKRIQLRKKILTDGKLEKYIDELTQRYPDKYIEMLRADLKSEKTFLSAINELEIEEANEESDMDDDQQGLIDEVRGIQTSGATGDDDDGF